VFFLKIICTKPAENSKNLESLLNRLLVKQYNEYCVPLVVASPPIWYLHWYIIIHHVPVIQQRAIYLNRSWCICSWVPHSPCNEFFEEKARTLANINSILISIPKHVINNTIYAPREQHWHGCTSFQLSVTLKLRHSLQFVHLDHIHKPRAFWRINTFM